MTASGTFNRTSETLPKYVVVVSVLSFERVNFWSKSFNKNGKLSLGWIIIYILDSIAVSSYWFAAVYSPRYLTEGKQRYVK